MNDFLTYAYELTVSQLPVRSLRYGRGDNGAIYGGGVIYGSPPGAMISIREFAQLPLHHDQWLPH